MSTKIDPKKFNKLLSDFAKALGVPKADLVEHNKFDDDYCLRRDYRYAKNGTLGFFLINLYEDSVEVIVDSAKGGCKVYSWHDKETFEVLRPLLHKALRARLEELVAQIVHCSDDGCIVMHPASPESGPTLYFRYKNEEYCAFATPDGEILVGATPASALAFVAYMQAVEKYLLPYAEGKKHA